jgi:hypothetical protein
MQCTSNGILSFESIRPQWVTDRGEKTTPEIFPGIALENDERHSKRLLNIVFPWKKLCGSPSRSCFQYYFSPLARECVSLRIQILYCCVPMATIVQCSLYTVHLCRLRSSTGSFQRQAVSLLIYGLIQNRVFISPVYNTNG